MILVAIAVMSTCKLKFLHCILANKYIFRISIGMIVTAGLFVKIMTDYLRKFQITVYVVFTLILMISVSSVSTQVG